MIAAAGRVHAISLDPSRQWLHNLPGQESDLSRLSEHGGDDIIMEQ